jgi:adenosyl cobinamide kinase/adenosyl cobinamide phosphate guanylyltransferase
VKRELILILGGARSGKSLFAQQLAQRMGKEVLFIATAEAEDEEMKERIRLHQAARPPEWRTLEEPLYLPEAVEQNSGHEVVLIDCLTLWLSNLLRGDETSPDMAREAAILEAVRRLLRAYEQGEATFILVSNEVGMGLVPPYPLGRRFRDLLGRVNQLIAAKAERVYLVVAGLGLELKAFGAEQISERDSEQKL